MPKSNAEHFATSFDTNFTNETRGLKNEVALFQAMTRTFSKLGNRIFDVAVKELHGRKGIVSYRSKELLAPATARCELCDLMIITYSNIKKEIRLTCFQAKYERKPKHQDPRQFTIDHVQWNLLAKRPDIISGTKKNTPPPSLLSAALLPSVGSYGFFYRNKSDPEKFEIFYTVADLLRPKTLSKAQYNRGYGVNTFAGFTERNATETSKDFARALYSLEIGTPVNIAGERHAPTRAWVAEIVSGLSRQATESSNTKNEKNDLSFSEMSGEIIKLLATKPLGNSSVSKTIGAKAVVLLCVDDIGQTKTNKTSTNKSK
jgi:hypothetical protein